VIREKGACMHHLEHTRKTNKARKANTREKARAQREEEM